MPRVSHGSSPVSGSSIVSEVRKFKGYPYVYGATGPSSFDCSGLVQYVFGQLGITAPRTSEDQWAWVKRISKSELQPGDLVFAQFPGDNASPGHVGIYTGGGQVLSAEDPAQGVGYASLASWGGNIVGYGQAPGTSGGGSGPGVDATAGGTTVNWNVFSEATSSIDELFTALGSATGLGAVAEAIGVVAKEGETVSKIGTWLTLPSNWVRIFAGIAGTAFLGAGVWFIMQEAGHG